MFTGIGAMMSFSSDENEFPEERLLSQAFPKVSHCPAGNMLESVRLMPASPNVEDTVPLFAVLPARVIVPPGPTLSVTGPAFTAPSANPVATRSTALFQHGNVLLASQSATLPPSEVIHLWRARTGTPLPPKS